jgi:hypothetical protein
MVSSKYDSDNTSVLVEACGSVSNKNNDEYSRIGMNFSVGEKSVFKSPNRKEEDELVMHYQKTGDETTHARLFEMRRSTIAVWAKRYGWVCDSADDLSSELSIVWLRCVKKYKYEAAERPVRTREGHLVKDDNGEVKTSFKRTPFNTFLFSSFRNHILNTIKKKHSKKRLDNEGNPIDLGMRSLDYEYGEEKEGSNLYEMIPDKSSPNPRHVSAEWIIKEVSRGDKEVEEVLRRFMTDKYVQDINTACILKSGSLKLRKSDRDILIAGGRKAHQYLKKMILKSKSFKDVQISSYQIYPKKVVFEVIVSDEALRRKVEKAIARAKSRLVV